MVPFAQEAHEVFTAVAGATGNGEYGRSLLENSKVGQGAGGKRKAEFAE